ncbi:MAG: hypothetical protein JWO15_1705 [Sphingomonadales bacterium]|nr:hypothetical protein [Sphingomonadales bacterium]
MNRSLAIVLLIALGSISPAHAVPPSGPAVIDHVAIQVVDLDKSVAFYKGLFGFPEAHAPFAGARWLEIGNGIMLHIVGNRTARSQHSRWDHIAIACGDMKAMIATLATQRIPWTNMEGNHAPRFDPME